MPVVTFVDHYRIERNKTMNEMMTLARALGEKLAESEQYKNFCETRDICKSNPKLKAKLDEFKVQKKIYDI